MPGDPGVPVATTRVHYQLRTRGYGCSGHPAFPTPSIGREINAMARARFAPRGAKSRLLFDNRILFRRPCESRDPYAVPCHFGRGGRGLLSQRTPVAMGSCFRRDDERVSPAHSRDPLARNDGLLISIDAVSLVVSRLQFTQAAYKTSRLEIFELNSFEMRCPKQICS